VRGQQRTVFTAGLTSSSDLSVLKAVQPRVFLHLIS